jgi:aminomethyltransferase
MANRTPLYETHVAAGARMVDFAGWDMPVQYSSIVEEHESVRQGVGLFDISHMGRLTFQGADALPLIQWVYTNDAAPLKEGQARYGLICNENGGIKDDVLVYRFADSLGMVVNASNRLKIVDWIKGQEKARSVAMRDTTLQSCMIAVQGPASLQCCRGVTEAELTALPYYHATKTTYRGKECMISRTGYTGEVGFEFIVNAEQGPELWRELTEQGGKPCGLGARDTLRLEAAMPLYGHELNEEIDPLQAGLGWAVKMNKGEFVGREAIARRQYANWLPHRVGLEIEGKRIAREGSPVLENGQVIGSVTSGTFAPTLGKVIAMAYISPACAEPGTTCQVDIRGKPADARVVPMPFYDRKKKT